MLEGIIQHGKKTAPPRIVLYGIEGIGKSTLAANAPKPIFLPTEDGLNQIECQAFPKITQLCQLNTALLALNEEDHDFQTVVIDSVDWLERIIFRELADNYGVRSVEKIDGGYGRGYLYALEEWKLLVDKLDALRANRKMGVILIGHAKADTLADPEAVKVVRYDLRLNKHAASLLCEWADAVLFATRQSGAARGVDGGDRILRTQASASCVAKNRYGFDEILPLEWAAIQDGIVKNN